MNSRAVKAIVAYGERYRDEFLPNSGTEKQLSEDWRDALKFFFDRAFYQGRSDATSDRVNEAALDVLKPWFSEAEQSPEGWDLEELRRNLQAKIGKGKVGRGNDVKMVISSLRYVSSLPDSNIVTHSVQCIEAREIGRHFSELQNEIFQVGPKIASFYLRDIVSCFQLDNKVSDRFQFTLQPIDVWVRSIAFDSGIVARGADDRQAAQAIVDLCTKEYCSPLLFNQGAWYAGKHALPY